MKTTTQLASILRLSLGTTAALVDGFMEWAAVQVLPFTAADVVFALDGDLAIWDTILFNERAGGNLVCLGGGRYEVAR